MFCVGVFLSFVGHFALMLSSGLLLAQILVSVAGIAIMTLVAYYISRSKRQDKPALEASRGGQGSRLIEAAGYSRPLTAGPGDQPAP